MSHISTPFPRYNLKKMKRINISSFITTIICILFEISKNKMRNDK